MHQLFQAPGLPGEPDELRQIRLHLDAIIANLLFKPAKLFRSSVGSERWIRPGRQVQRGQLCFDPALPEPAAHFFSLAWVRAHGETDVQLAPSAARELHEKSLTHFAGIVITI